MDSDQETGKWICRACGNEFTPQPPNYSCPKCNSSNTISDKNNKAIQLEDKRLQNEAQSLSQEEKPTVEPLSVLLGIPAHASYEDLTEKLHRHLQSIGVDTKNIVQPKKSDLEDNKGVLKEIRESVDKLPTTKGKLIAVAEVESRNIDRVEVVEILIMVPTGKKGWKREIAYIHRYIVDEAASSFERAHAKPGIFDSLVGSETMIADTKRVEDGGLFSKGILGFKWVNPNLGLISHKGRYEDEDRFVSDLNADGELNDELFRLGVYPDIGVYLCVEDGNVSVNHGMGDDVSGFPTRETFDAFDRIAKHIKTMNKPASI